MRYKFSDLVSIHPNGSVSPKQPLRYGSVALTPGISLGSGVSLNGLDLASHAGEDIEAESVDGVLVISQFYSA
jgi:hypothetical protein